MEGRATEIDYKKNARGHFGLASGQQQPDVDEAASRASQPAYPICIFTFSDCAVKQKGKKKGDGRHLGCCYTAPGIFTTFSYDPAAAAAAHTGTPHKYK